jgi:hypothetical protein
VSWANTEDKEKDRIKIKTKRKKIDLFMGDLLINIINKSIIFIIMMLILVAFNIK